MPSSQNRSSKFEVRTSTHRCPIKTHGLFDHGLFDHCFLDKSDTHVGAASSRDSARFDRATSESIAAGSRSYDNLIFHVLRADFLIRYRETPVSLISFHLLMEQQWVRPQLVLRLIDFYEYCVCCCYRDFDLYDQMLLEAISNLSQYKELWVFEQLPDRVGTIGY